MIQPQLTTVLFPDLLPWEKEALAPMIGELSLRYPTRQLVLSAKLPKFPRAEVAGAPLWLLSKDWQRAVRWARGHRGPIFASVLCLSHFTHPLPLLFLRNLRSSLPGSAKLITHSPLSHRFFREMEGIREGRVHPMPLPILEGELSRPSRSGGVVIAGTVARFVAESNLHYLLNVAHYAVRRMPELRFRILGSGPLQTHLIKMVRELDLTRAVEVKPATFDEVRALDLFLHVPIRNEHFIPLLLAGAASLPVLSCEVPGVKDLIVEGREGFIVGANETKPMGELVLRLARDGALRRALGESFGRKLREDCSARRLAPLYEALFFSREVHGYSEPAAA